ncbi:MAG: hypothetical protein WAM30_11720 [Candidatus Dormiibacterota bacterium]
MAQAIDEQRLGTDIREHSILVPSALVLATAVVQSDCGQPLLLPAPFLDRCRDAVRSVLFDTDSRVLGVTSSGAEPRKASVAAGIATSLALDTGEPTVLVECDPERPTYASTLGIQNPLGLVDWLREQGPLHVAKLQALRNAFVIPVGGDGNDVGATFYQLTQTDLVPYLRRAFKNVVLDLPPIRDQGHSILATHLADRILLTASAGRSSLPDLRQTVQLLDPSRVQGIVLTDFESRIPRWLQRLL